MISATAFTRWYFVPLFLAQLLAQILTHHARLLVSGALVSVGNVASLFVSVFDILVNTFEHLAKAFSIVNTTLVLMVCVRSLWSNFTSTASSDFDSPSAGSQPWHDTTNTTPGAVPDSEPSRTYQNWTRSTFSKGGASPNTPPATPPRTPGTTSSAWTSNAAWNYGDSLRGHGIGHGYEYGYGQRRVAPIIRTLLHPANQ